MQNAAGEVEGGGEGKRQCNNADMAGPVLNNRLRSHESYVIEEKGQGTNLAY